MRGIEPYKERFLTLVGFGDEILRRRQEFLVHRLHPLLGKRTRVLDLLLAVGPRPAMQHTPRAEVLLEVRKIFFRRIVAQLRLFYWQGIAPALALMSLVLGLNLLADALREESLRD